MKLDKWITIIISVAILSFATNSCSSHLGFDIPDIIDSKQVVN